MLFIKLWDQIDYIFLYLGCEFTFCIFIVKTSNYFQFILEAVSYTHLDVYKRQAAHFFIKMAGHYIHLGLVGQEAKYKSTCRYLKVFFFFYSFTNKIKVGNKI